MVDEQQEDLPSAKPSGVIADKGDHVLDKKDPYAQKIELNEQQSGSKEEKENKNGGSFSMLNAVIVLLALAVAVLLFFRFSEGKQTEEKPSIDLSPVDISVLREMINNRSLNKENAYSYFEQTYSYKDRTGMQRTITSGDFSREINGTQYAVSYFSIKDPVKFVSFSDLEWQGENGTQKASFSCLSIYGSDKQCSLLSNDTSSLSDMREIFLPQKAGYSLELSFLNTTASRLGALAEKGLITDYKVYASKGHLCADYVLNYSRANKTTQAVLEISDQLLDWTWKVSQCNNEKSEPVDISWAAYYKGTLMDIGNSSVSQVMISDEDIIPKKSSQRAEDLAYTYFQISNALQKCFSISNQTEQDNCIFKASRDFEVFRLCEFMSSEQSKAICIGASFSYHMDYSACELLSEGQYRDDCYVVAAMATDNNACRFVQDSELMAKCMENAKQRVTQCTVDSECAIYDGQYCLPVANASAFNLSSYVPGNATGCNVFASCKCVSSMNKCGWQLTDAFRECKATEEMQKTKADVMGTIKNNSSNSSSQAPALPGSDSEAPVVDNKQGQQDAPQI